MIDDDASQIADQWSEAPSSTIEQRSEEALRDGQDGSGALLGTIFMFAANCADTKNPENAAVNPGGEFAAVPVVEVAMPRRVQIMYVALTIMDRGSFDLMQSAMANLEPNL